MNKLIIDSEETHLLVNRVFHRCRNAHIDYAISKIESHFQRLGYKVKMKVSISRQSVGMEIKKTSKSGTESFYDITLQDAHIFKYTRHSSVSKFVFGITDVSVGAYGWGSRTKSNETLEFEAELKALNDNKFFHELLFGINYPFTTPNDDDIANNYNPRNELCGMEGINADYFTQAITNANKTAILHTPLLIEHTLRNAGFETECELIDSEQGKFIEIKLLNKRSGKWDSFRSRLILMESELESPIHETAPNTCFSLSRLEFDSFAHKAKPVENIKAYLQEKMNDGSLQSIVGASTFPYREKSYLSC